MTFYTDMRDDVAGSLISEFGFSMTLLEPNPAITHDGATGFDSGGSPDLEYIVTGVLTRFRAYERNGSEILRDDVKVILKAEDIPVAPTQSMKLIAQGVTYEIMDVSPIRPGGVDIIYTLQARK